ncbi:hypothetical protein M9H77_24636 [Catharanthus roseus]|uniref:Uncharacterized protein n=1 Tax=Catharanthus roseus TaxID=4058 RepID=A0ACC0AZG4_CATRO|nr:hypothetical protein M9H77_24636 [Catharanthus roseus]
MGHRNMFSSSQLFENENDQGWNHGEQPYMHLARTGAPDHSTIGYPLENNTVDGGHFTAHWNSAPRSTGSSSSTGTVEMPPYQLQIPGPSRDPFLHPSAVGSSNMIAENHAPHASSSNLGGQNFHGVDGGFFDITTGSSRGPYKRKSPGIPAVCERGNTSRYYEPGSSSEQEIPLDVWLEKQHADSHHGPWDFVPGYRSNGISIGGEGTLRNVRSRPAVDLENNLARTHLSSNPPHHAYTSQTSDLPGTADLLGQNPNAPSREWNHSFTSSASSGRSIASDANANANIFGHETNHFNVVSGNPSASMDMGGYFNDFSSNRNPVPQNLHAVSGQYARGVRSSYTQRPMPSFRASSSNLRMGNTTPSDEGLQAVAENYTSRHHRQLPPITLCNGDRNGRSRIPTDRYRTLSDDTGFRDRLTPEGLMIMDRTGIYGSRSMFDQHREMRLDIDNMTYEDLLALGERIGSVNTGLSEDSISKCLTESLYCSSDQLQEEGSCVICLEEYKFMDDVGTIKSCGHDFHVGCIRKWLSIKNSCPICKSAALEEN